MWRSPCAARKKAAPVLVETSWFRGERGKVRNRRIHVVRARPDDQPLTMRVSPIHWLRRRSSVAADESPDDSSGRCRPTPRPLILSRTRGPRPAGAPFPEIVPHNVLYVAL